MDILKQLKAEILEYGSICVEYTTDKPIEEIVEDILKQVKRQVIDIIESYDN